MRKKVIEHLITILISQIIDKFCYWNFLINIKLFLLDGVQTNILNI